MDTLAAVLYENENKLKLERLLIQEPQEGEVLVKVKAAGLCHSDWNFVTGDSSYNLPVVLGHEGAGVVIKIGKNVKKIQQGDRVLFNSGPNCGYCFVCHHYHPSLCETYNSASWSGVMLDGTTRLLNSKNEEVFQLASVGCFSEYIVLPEPWCVKILQTTPFEIGAIISCAVTTGVGAVIHTSNFRAGANAIVFGVGGVGANVILGLKLAKANKIFAVEKNKSKKNIAVKLGVSEFIEYTPENFDYITNLKKQQKIEYIYEAAGDIEAQHLAVECLSPGGVVTLIGIPPVKSKTFFHASSLTRQEKTIKGSYYGTMNTESNLRYYEELYKMKNLDLDLLITHKYTLPEINSGYRNLLEGKHLRGIVLF